MCAINPLRLTRHQSTIRSHLLNSSTHCKSCVEQSSLQLDGIPTTNLEVCESCEKKVYPLEKVETNNKIFHKQCFRCLQCNCILRMDTFTLNNGRLYCIPHFKQLFITRGNYDEGFGINPHKNKWSSSNAGPATMPHATNSPTPIAVSNGDL